MTIIGMTFTFVVGWCFCYQWGSHRARYYRHQLDKALIFCDTMRDANELLAKKLDRLEALGVKEDPDSFQSKIDRGIMRGIERVQQQMIGD